MKLDKKNGSFVVLDKDFDILDEKEFKRMWDISLQERAEQLWGRDWEHVDQDSQDMSYAPWNDKETVEM